MLFVGVGWRVVCLLLLFVGVCRCVLFVVCGCCCCLLVVVVVFGLWFVS